MADDEPEVPGGPRAMAEKLIAQIADLEAKMVAADNNAKETKRLRKVLAMNRKLLSWCKTRAGY